jgi:hypothetical protein
VANAFFFFFFFFFAFLILSVFRAIPFARHQCVHDWADDVPLARAVLHAAPQEELEWRFVHPSRADGDTAGVDPNGSQVIREWCALLS